MYFCNFAMVKKTSPHTSAHLHGDLSLYLNNDGCQYLLEGSVDEILLWDQPMLAYSSIVMAALLRSIPVADI